MQCRRMPAASASHPTLPSVASAHPLRRSASLTGTAKLSAAKHWEETLRERLGTAGEPPGRDVLPSLYDPRRKAAAAQAAAVARHSTCSRSVPPSSIGPSASIVAWFGQFQCESCGKIPMSLEARFCCNCGLPLPLPTLPGCTGAAKSLGEVAAVAAEAVQRRGGETPANEAAAAAAAAPKGASCAGGASAAAAQQRGQEDRRSGTRKPRGGSRVAGSVPPGARPPRGLPSKGKAFSTNAAQKPLTEGQRATQLAAWLSEVKPRQPVER